MLMLNRRVGEAVMIADDITVVALSVKGMQVRSGFVADATVPIHGQEIHQRIKRERTCADAPSRTVLPNANDATLRLNRPRPETPARTVRRRDRDSWVDE